MFHARVKHEDTAGEAPHVLDAGEVLVQLHPILVHLIEFFFLQAHPDAAVGERGFHLLQLVEAPLDGLEVGEHAAQPALVDEELVGALGFLFQDFRGLALGADKQYRFAAGHGIADEGISLFQAFHGLLQIDDVNAVPLAENESLHLRVPAIGLVTEVDTCLEKIANAEFCHAFTSFPACGAPDCGRREVVSPLFPSERRGAPISCWIIGLQQGCKP